MFTQLIKYLIYHSDWYTLNGRRNRRKHCNSDDGAQSYDHCNMSTHVICCSHCHMMLFGQRSKTHQRSFQLGT